MERTPQKDEKEIEGRLNAPNNRYGVQHAVKVVLRKMPAVTKSRRLVENSAPNDWGKAPLQFNILIYMIF